MGPRGQSGRVHTVAPIPDYNTQLGWTLRPAAFGCRGIILRHDQHWLSDCPCIRMAHDVGKRFIDAQTDLFLNGFIKSIGGCESLDGAANHADLSRIAIDAQLDPPGWLMHRIARMDRTIHAGSTSLDFLKAWQDAALRRSGPFHRSARRAIAAIFALRSPARHPLQSNGIRSSLR